MNNRFFNKIINGIEYTLVDTIEYQGIEVKCYLCDDDYAFTINIDGNEKLITNQQIIQDIKEQEELNPPEVYYYNILLHIPASNLSNMDLEKNNEIIAEFMEALNYTDFDIDKDKIQGILEKLKFAYGRSKKNNVAAFYHPVLNAIVVDPKCNDIETLFHEIIHACGGALYQILTLNMSGFIEGATDLTTSRVLRCLDEKGSYDEKILFNYYVDGYNPVAAIIRQMEYLLNKSCSPDMLNGKTDFFKEFKKKYGNNLYRTLLHRTSKMLKNGYYKRKDITKLFMDTQNMLLEEAFYKEGMDVYDLESAKSYMSKLKGFEYMMGIETEKVELNIFESYYKEKLSLVIDLLKGSRISQEEIEEFKRQYAYEKPKFNKVYSKQDEIDLAFFGCDLYAKYIVMNQIKEIDFDKFEIFTGAGYNCSVVTVLTYDGKVVNYNKGSFGEKTYYTGDGVTPEIVSELIKTENGFEVEMNGEKVELKRVEGKNIKEKMTQAISDEMMCVNKSNDASPEEENQTMQL